MTYYRNLVAVWACVLLACIALNSAPGCGPIQQDDRQTYAAVNDSFIATVTVLNQARVADEFDDTEWNDTILPLIELGNDLLDDYDAATKADVPAEPLVDQLQTVLSRLQPYVSRATE